MKLTPQTLVSFLAAVFIVGAIVLSQEGELEDGPSPTDSVADSVADSLAYSLATLAVQPTARATRVVSARPTVSAVPTATASPTVTPKPTVTSTATGTPTPTPTRTPTPWPTDTVHPPATVGKALVVDQELQVLRVYENGVEVRTLPASTGRAPYYTPAYAGRVRYYIGTFYSFDTWADDAWYIFMAEGEVMIHSLPYTKAGEEKIYEGQEHLGVRPSSHGCIRLRPDAAAWLTAWNPAGAPILITPPVVGKEW
jgi:lipoprotein-anchoring transpeptidase ErfK/SrfK